MSNWYQTDLRGQISSGPKAYPRTYTDTMKEPTVEFVSLKALMTCGSDGANRAEAKGVIKVKNEMIPPFIHFFFIVQFSGF